MFRKTGPHTQRDRAIGLAVAARRELRDLRLGAYPTVMMMKPAENRPSGTLAALLDLALVRRIFVQGQMRPCIVAITRVGRKNPAQMGFAEDDDVIQAFPADRANQSLRMPVLPGLPRGRRVITDAHGGKTPGDGVTVRRVAIPDEVVRRFVPGKGIGDAASNSLRRRIGRHRERL